MRTFNICSAYRQFYVADMDIKPLAPCNWTDEDVDRRFALGPGIIALSPCNDMTPAITVHWFDNMPSDYKCDFIANAKLVVSGENIGIFGWPWELMDSKKVFPGTFSITFTGHDIHLAEQEKDYYDVWIGIDSYSIYSRRR